MPNTKGMTKAATRAAIKAAGMIGVWSSEWRQWRVTHTEATMPDKARREDVAYYTDDNEDALDTARAMRKHFDNLTPDQRSAVIKGNTL